MYNFSMQTKLSPAQIISWRSTRRRQRKQGPKGSLPRITAGLLALFSILLAVGVILTAYYYATYASDLPAISGLPSLLGPGGGLRYPTMVFDRSGEYLLYTIENPNTIEAEYLYLEAIPETAIEAALLVRDPNFWEHPGYELNAEKPSLAEQLVLELLLDSEPE